MLIKLIKLSFFSLLILLTPGVFAQAVQPVTPDALKMSIEARTKELEAINAQILQTNSSLNQLQWEKKSLSGELKKFEYSISQVNLGIKSSEITLEKLNLELTDLNQRSEEAEKKIISTREGIAGTLKLMQKKDSEGLMFMLLKNDSLVDGAFEAQALRDLQDVLSVNINDLTNLHEQLELNIAEKAKKKAAMESENRNLKNRKFILADQKQEKNDILKNVKSKESVYQQQLNQLEAQQESMSRAIAEIENELRSKFDSSILPFQRPGVFAWPITLRSQGGSGVITQHVGEVSRLYRGRPHNGLDIGAPLGTPVMAAEDGIVTVVGNNGAKLQYGKYILIKHPNNMTTLYAHLSRQIAFQGQQVRRGEVIGYVGTTGYSTGPHLHFGVYWTASMLMKPVYPATGLVPIGVIIDPEGYL